MILPLQSMKKEVHPSTPTPIFDNILAISSLRHAGMDCRHLGPQDASEHIHVNLGPGTPCRDDEYCNVYVTHTNLMAIGLQHNQIFEGGHEIRRV